MDDRVFKFPLEITQRQMLQLPRGARVLSVALLQEQPVLFALVSMPPADHPERRGREISVPAEPRIIRIARTGERFNSAGCHFIGTLCFEAVGHTFHVFEQTEGVPDVREPRFQQDYADVSNAVPYAPDPSDQGMDPEWRRRCIEHANSPDPLAVPAR